MNRAELLAELRSVVDDTLQPYGWSDMRLLHWLSEAQDEFCEETGFWSDTSTYKIITVLNQVDYTLSDRIIAVRSVWDGMSCLLDLSAGSNKFQSNYPPGTPPSRPYRYRTDLETGVLTLPDPPIAGVELELRVHRRSKVALSDAVGQPEIPARFHLALVEYAAYKAFGDHDRELQDPVKAADHLSNFRWYIKEGRRAHRRLTGEYADIVPNSLYVV